MTAKIVAVFNQKGGCAKTMSTMQIGGALGRRGYRVLVVDMDRQNTGLTWSSMADPNEPFPATVISLAPLKEKMVSEVGKMVENYDLVLIDCPPAIESPIPWAALLIADIAIMPVIPVMDNIWASAEAKALAVRAQQENPALRLFFLPSAMRRGNLFTVCLEKLVADNPEVPLLTGLTQRNAFPESQAYGSTVHLVKNAEAIKELDALATEVEGILGLQLPVAEAA